MDLPPQAQRHARCCCINSRHTDCKLVFWPWLFSTAAPNCFATLRGRSPELLSAVVLLCRIRACESYHEAVVSVGL